MIKECEVMPLICNQKWKEKVKNYNKKDRDQLEVKETQMLY